MDGLRTYCGNRCHVVCTGSTSSILNSMLSLDGMSELKPYQSCRKNEGWMPVNVASDSRPIDWVVMVSPWGNPLENICECPGYLYKGKCKHQIIAMKKTCRWTELEGPELQTESQVKSKTCPRCGGPTSWELEVVDGDASS